ncbi:hypothetical protein F9C07_2145 [Aspergillus flavus]|uniref:Uncharacterized protein n=1 Tax=Aspergillus flavus (strain ATCC 200026 / FGSC A1120 / IAM 13836 / NRRL 3357 / JCM 12722 / SRRC 167) TaxID=332952 RepID=A0A7U2MGM5_ASPFN|nr:hypothetical protein F9C07_2145 [Aspergillus flavus]
MEKKKKKEKKLFLPRIPHRLSRWTIKIKAEGGEQEKTIGRGEGKVKLKEARTE